MMYSAKEQRLEVGFRCDYITFGRGEKPLILIQGLGTRSVKGAAASLAFMYRIFAKDYKVYMFDRREKVGEGITVRDLASDTAAAMDALGIKKADIIGVSQGGMIAQYLAIDRPDLVDKLVLAVTLSRNNDIVTSAIEEWISLTEQGNYKRLVSDMAERMYSEEYVKRYRPLLPLLTLLQKPKDPERFIRLAKACLTCEAYAELHKIRAPVFVIGGRRDKVVGGEASEEIADRLGCRIFMYENSGHAAYEEEKDFNKRIFDFLRE